MNTINKNTDALIVIDMQNDFCPGGSLAVKDGDLISEGIIELSKQFKHVVLTQDWHPEDHFSFASNHEGAPPFSTIDCDYGKQVLWPDHCIQGTLGANFVPDILTSNLLNKAALIIRKGMNSQIDSYSAFFENDHKTSTGLAGYLNEKNIQNLYFVGLAYDFCVGFSALDARQHGFQSFIVKDLCKAIAQPLPVNEEGFKDTTEMMEDKFFEANVKLINSSFLSVKQKPSI